MARSRSSNAGGQNPEEILQHFEGMNLLDAREGINDEEFYWCENAIPVAKGVVYPVSGPSAALATVGGETGSPSYTMTFNALGTDYTFAVWSNTGNGWIVNMTTFATTLIIAGLTSGQTSATQYSNLGLLIVDPIGYWDWNVTTPNTLTIQNNAVASVALTFASNLAGGVALKNIVTVGGGRTGATFRNTYSVFSVAILAAGAGYAVNDVITLTDNNPTTPTSILVTTIGGGGAITGITLLAGGSYPGPATTALANTGPTGAVLGGSSAGAGATFTVFMKAITATILTPGSGYTTGDVERDLTAANNVITIGTLTSSGVISGTSISTYAGRVWIGLGRVIFFTDINSYNAFGGAGGSFTITDAYLHNTIAALFSANNYLYIFGEDSIDALSNVTITNGLTTFSRINLTASIGTSNPTSIFSYYRAVAFHHASGFYLLSGATPEKISEKIAEAIKQIVPSVAHIYGCQVLINTELCAAMLFTFHDVFTNTTPGGVLRHLMALYFKGRWWVYSLAALNAQAMISIPATDAISGNPGVATIYAWAGPSLYRAFAAGAASAWRLRTKLWDGGAPLHEKQSVNVAVGVVTANMVSSTLTVSVDTELSASALLPVPVTPSFAGYQLKSQLANIGGSQYLGLTLTGTIQDTTQIKLLAIRGKADRDMLQ